ncbi:hypothetical protein ACNHKD_16060 [Methylocystis sp. JAN1]|uniref:hypothetical protein n=1 Tax=Methylocystis sp. JAN1 TaxID=3397211 RepID=UPI003FA1E506
MSNQEVTFHFIKANDCKDIAVDGAFGGISVSGKIAAAIYSERPPIPKSVTHAVDGNSLGPELEDKREVRDGPVRSVNAVLYFDLASATSFRDWLDGKIKELSRLQGK